MYLNPSKEQRAREVIAKPSAFPADPDNTCVERVALKEGQEKKLEGEALVEYIYRRIGGAVKGEATAVETRVGVLSEETSGKEVEEIGKRKRKA